MKSTKFARIYNNHMVFRTCAKLNVPRMFRTTNFRTYSTDLNTNMAKLNTLKEQPDIHNLKALLEDSSQMFKELECTEKKHKDMATHKEVIEELLKDVEVKINPETSEIYVTLKGKFRNEQFKQIHFPIIIGIITAILGMLLIIKLRTCAPHNPTKPYAWANYTGVVFLGSCAGFFGGTVAMLTGPYGVIIGYIGLYTYLAYDKYKEMNNDIKTIASKRNYYKNLYNVTSEKKNEYYRENRKLKQEIASLEKENKQMKNNGWF
jgi:hypothetical protein